MKQGVTVERRYHLQKFGTIDIVNIIGILKRYQNNTVSHSLSKSSPYDGQITHIMDYRKIIDEYKWGKPETLYDHFNRHGKELLASDYVDYALKSQDLYKNRAQHKMKIGRDGIVRVYDETNNLFGSYNTDGTTRTFFKPAGKNYWNNQQNK